MTETRDRLRALIRDRFAYDPAIYPDADKVQLVADFKLDSLDIVELVMSIEDDFGIEIADAESERFVGDDGTVGATFGELVALVEDKLGDRAADAFSDMCESEPPVSMAERAVIDAQRDKQWGVK